ncbi:hypothetical protein MJO28_017603, partial [Puccinia striiformis f. sp. tritici]
YHHACCCGLALVHGKQSQIVELALSVTTKLTSCLFACFSYKQEFEFDTCSFYHHACCCGLALVHGKQSQIVELALSVTTKLASCMFANMAIKSKKAARISVQTQKPLAAKNHVPVIPPSPPATDPTTRLDRALDVDDKEEEDTDDSDAIPQGSQVVQRQKTPSMSQAVSDRIAAIPEDLHFYLDVNIDLEKKPSTKATLLKMIKHFFPTYKAPSSHTRGLLARAYKQKVEPLLSSYIESMATYSDESDDDQNMEEAPKPLPLAGINPNNSSVTVDKIIGLISQQYPKLKLPETMKKKAAIALYHQYIMPPPVGGYPTEPFREPSPKVPVPYHGLLTVEELRFGIHCHAYPVYVIGYALKPVLMAIYVQFVLDDINEGVPIFEGVHYGVPHRVTAKQSQPSAE